MIFDEMKRGLDGSTRPPAILRAIRSKRVGREWITQKLTCHKRYPSFQIHQTFFYSSQPEELQLRMRVAGEGDLLVASQITVCNVKR